MRELDTRDAESWLTTLRAGEEIALSGVVYTARDAAHKRIFACLEAGEQPPFPIDGAFIYYAGPTPARPGEAIGSCGPTTSARMDKFTPELFSRGLAGCIGKGERSREVRDAIARRGGVYLCAIGGAGALAAEHIASCEVIAFPELGCESVKRLRFERFPLFVAYDSAGGSIFK